MSSDGEGADRTEQYGSASGSGVVEQTGRDRYRNQVNVHLSAGPVVIVFLAVALSVALWVVVQHEPDNPTKGSTAQSSRPASNSDAEGGPGSSSDEWHYPDGTHLARVDNSPTPADSGQESWIWVDDRQADRHWAGVVFLLEGEPWAYTRDTEKWHLYIDDNGANNNERSTKPGIYPRKDIIAAAICEGVGSKLLPHTCTDWKKFEPAQADRSAW